MSQSHFSEVTIVKSLVYLLYFLSLFLSPSLFLSSPLSLSPPHCPSHTHTHTHVDTLHPLLLLVLMLALIFLPPCQVLRVLITQLSHRGSSHSPCAESSGYFRFFSMTGNASLSSLEHIPHPHAHPGVHKPFSSPGSQK